MDKDSKDMGFLVLCSLRRPPKKPDEVGLHHEENSHAPDILSIYMSAGPSKVTGKAGCYQATFNSNDSRCSILEVAFKVSSLSL